MATKQTIVEALRSWINQRPRLEFADYGDVSAYRSESRRITRQLHDARELLRAVEWRDSVTADMLREGFRAYSGRLTLKEAPDGSATLDYCTGQYWPTEYRAAACAVLASALWSWQRENMPACNGKVTRQHGPFSSEFDAIDGIPAGDWLRRSFRREFGARLASRWFD